VWSLKPERWGSLLVQQKYREEKACDKKHPYRIIIIIIIIIIIKLLSPAYWIFHVTIIHHFSMRLLLTEHAYEISTYFYLLAKDRWFV
jgi:hypothetical protein